jgi:heme/copper-type cytochrome/quinol oxidase subunit 1
LFWLYSILTLLLLGSNLLFLPLHSLGLLGFPRRISDYPISFIFWSLILLIGILTLAFIVLVCA